MSKSEGVKDIVKWLDEKLKKKKLLVEQASKESKAFTIDNEYGDFLDECFKIEKAEFDTMLSLKISIEKYMKKLQHQGE